MPVESTSTNRKSLPSLSVWATRSDNTTNSISSLLETGSISFLLETGIVGLLDCGRHPRARNEATIAKERNLLMVDHFFYQFGPVRPSMFESLAPILVSVKTVTSQFAASIFPNRPGTQDIAFHRTHAAKSRTSAVQHFCRTSSPAFHRSLSEPFPRKSAMKVSWFETTTRGWTKAVQPA